MVNCSHLYKILVKRTSPRWELGHPFGGKNGLVEFESVNDGGLQVRDGISLGKESSVRLSLGREQCCSVFRETGAEGLNRKLSWVKG